MSQPLQLKGRRFGKLKVIGTAPKNQYNRTQWKCHCDCGTELLVETRELQQAGPRRSCGCVKAEVARANGALYDGHNHVTHGQERPSKGGRTSEMASFRSAKNRCNNPKGKSYVDYGGRGIQFRFDSFQEFYAELGLRPEGYSLDRINNNGHYEKGNVKWSTQKEQCANRRNRRWHKKPID